MSTSDKTPASIRQGGPGSSHENAKEPLQEKKGTPASDQKRHSQVSGGGGERDKHHTRDPNTKSDTNKAH